ncbi:hypothetical protein FQZ97_589980 [compost metagenome]
MKKLALIALFLVSIAAIANAQTDSLAKAVQERSAALGQTGKNEIKFNLLFGVIGMPEISYERLIDDNMGAGLAVLFGLSKDIDYRFSLTPYYRVYFGNKIASGFFIEGNASILKRRYGRVYHFGTGSGYQTVDRNGFGIGAAIGGKFLSRNGFLGEAYFGVGRTMGEGVGIYAYPRAGFTIGKRF